MLRGACILSLLAVVFAAWGCAGREWAEVGSRGQTPGDAATLQAGVSLLEAGEHAKALDVFDRLLLGRPSDPELHYHRGVALHGLAARKQGGLTAEGDALLSAANVAYERAVELGSTDARAYYAFGRINTGGGHTADTLHWMDRALAIDPDFVDAHLDRALALWGLGRHEEALAAFDRTVELKPDHARAQLWRARLLGEMGRFEDALAAHDHAVEIAPRDPQAHFHRGCTLAQLGRHDEALRAHERALELWPAFHGAHRGRGEALEALGRLEEALVAYSRAQRVDGYGRTVEPEANTNFTASLLKARLLVRLERHDEAVEAYDAVLATRRDDLEIRRERREAAEALHPAKGRR